MIYHFQKKWRLKLRRDPDAGRVLFIGPLVVSLDVIARPRSAFAQGAESGGGSRPSTGTHAKGIVRALLERVGYRIEYVCEWGVYEYRYDGADSWMNRPIHKDMSVAPPWAKRRITRARGLT